MSLDQFPTSNSAWPEGARQVTYREDDGRFVADLGGHRVYGDSVDDCREMIEHLLVGQYKVITSLRVASTAELHGMSCGFDVYAPVAA